MEVLRVGIGGGGGGGADFEVEVFPVRASCDVVGEPSLEFLLVETICKDWC